MKEFADKIYRNKITYILRNLAISFLIMYILKCMCDYDCLSFQAYKDVAVYKSWISFAVVLMILSKINIFKIRYLFSLIIYAPCYIFRIVGRGESTDLIRIDVYKGVFQLLVIWIFLDLLAKNEFTTRKISKIFLFIFLTLSCFAMYYSNGQMEPIGLVVLFGLFFAQNINKEEWENFCLRICDGFFLATVYIDAKSLIFYPINSNRYYGCFVNIGPFGMFHGCLLVLSIFGIGYIWKKYGWKHFMFFGGVVWMVFTIFMSYLINTRTLMIGQVFALLVIYLFMRKRIDKKSIIIRSTLVLSIFVVGVIVLIIMSSVSSERYIYWKAVVEAENEKSFLHYNIFRVYSSLVGLQYVSSPDMARYTHPFIKFLDCISSYRIQIWEAYFREISFEGKNIGGVQTGHYFALGPHNQYINALARYGYIGGTMYIVLFVLGCVSSLKKYLKERTWMNFLPILWLAMMLGIWIGESCDIAYPVTFFGLVLIYPTVRRLDE